MKGTHFYDLNHECSTVVKPKYDENSNLIVDQKVVDHLKSHIIPIENARRERESGIFDYEVFTLTSDDIDKLRKKFTRNYGSFVDGKIMKINKSEFYFKFTTNIAIAVDAGIKRLSKTQKLFDLISLYDRSIQQFPTLSLFINGLKIPDNEIMIYMTESGTELLVPEKYLTKDSTTDKYNPIEVYVQKHVYQKYHYCTITRHSIPNKNVIIDLADEKLKRCKLAFKYKYENGIKTDKIESCKNIIIYANGFYKPESAYSIEISNNKLIINMNNNNFNSSDSIEIVIDSDVKVTNTLIINGDYSQTANMIRCYFNLPESTLDYKTNFLFGSLPKQNCYFYINNKRINPNDIKQIGRLNYMYEKAGTPHIPYTCTIIYTDKDYIDESRKYIYGEDYYLSNFYGIDNISKILGKLADEQELKSTDPFINKYLLSSSVDIKKIMNKYGLMYDENYVSKINDLDNRITDNNSRVRELIKESGNYLIRDLLNLYGNDDIFDEVQKDSHTPDYISYTFKTKKDEETKTTGYYYEVTVNGDHIPDSKYVIDSKYQYNHIKIPKEILKFGLNRIHIREKKFDTGISDEMEYQLIKSSDLSERTNVSESELLEYEDMIEQTKARIEYLENNDFIVDGVIQTEAVKQEEIDNLKHQLETYKNGAIANYKYSYTFDKFLTPLDISDYICLVPVSYNDKLYFAKGKSSGWIIDSNVSFNASGNKITLYMRDKPETNFVIYSMRFAFKFSMSIDSDLSKLEDMSINIVSKNTYDLPVIPVGSYVIFLNGERLYNGIDYVFRHPGNYNLITYTSLCLKRKTKAGDEIEVYFDDVQNVTVGRSNDILSHSGTVWNKYGLIYFGNIRYPYSPKYIDLYINGKYIYPDQIDILSDKLIRVDPEILNPMFDIFAETSFGVDIDKLKYFFDYEGNRYEDSDFEKLIGNLFKEYDFSTITNPVENAHGNEIYESFDDDVDSWGHIPNTRRAEDSDEAMELAEKAVSKRYNLYETAYLLWLHSNDVKTIMTNGKNVKQEIMNYFRFYVEDTNISERQDVYISARNTKTFNDIVFNGKNYPYEYAERVMRFLKFAKGNNISLKETPDKLRNHLPVSNVMYPRDFPKVISSRTRIAQTNRDLVIGGKPGPIYNNTTTHKN
jgi:hypothetical protein